MDRNQVWCTIDVERAALASMLASLDESEWSFPSLCAGWTVRDVAAHVISSPQATPLNIMGGMLRARGDFDRAIFTEARRRAARPTDQIIADYHRLAGSRRHPLGTTHLDPLLDVLVHTQDIAVPLGRAHAMPLAAAAAAASLVWRRAFPFHARQRLRLHRLIATDTPWSAGDGAIVEGPIQAILLLLTGRTSAVTRVPGSAVLQLVAPRGASS